MKPTFLTDFLNLLYPDLCIICNENLTKAEQHICFSCLNNIPKTSFHLMTNNPVEKRFWGKVPIQNATAFYFFQKGSPFQKLLHELKYRDNKLIGEVMGKYAAADLSESLHFADVDVIVPVPLHPRKYARRGYNQSEWIARGLGSVLEKPLDTKSLRRVIENPTQTRKSVYERWENTDGIFDVTNTEVFEGKGVLLVDDVLTTGSTIEACAKALLKINGVKVFVFTLAVA